MLHVRRFLEGTGMMSFFFSKVCLKMCIAAELESELCQGVPLGDSRKDVYSHICSHDNKLKWRS
jgi:hypothetical protein